MQNKYKRIAQLGNSHSQAIAEALVDFQTDWVTISSFPMFHHWRIAASASPCADRTIAIDRLDKVNTRIPLDDFELYIVSAAGWWAGRDTHLMGLGAAHPLAFVRCAHWGVPSAAAPKHLQIVSRAVFEEMIYTWVARHDMAELVRFLAMEANKKVIWASWPVPSRSILLQSPKWLLSVWYEERAPKVWRDYRATEQCIVRRLTAEYGGNVTLLPTPRREMEEEGFMDESLAANDPFHGNKKYGVLVVKQLLPLI